MILCDCNLQEMFEGNFERWPKKGLRDAKSIVGKKMRYRYSDNSLQTVTIKHGWCHFGECYWMLICEKRLVRSIQGMPHMYQISYGPMASTAMYFSIPSFFWRKTWPLARPPVLVKGLGKATIQILLNGESADVHLLSGRFISTISVDPDDRYSILRERARGALLVSHALTFPEALHADFSANGMKLESHVLRRKVRKNQIKGSKGTHRQRKVTWESIWTAS